MIFPFGLSFSAAYFEVEANKPEYDAGTMTSSYGKSDTSGFELQLIGSVTDQWFVSAGYTSLDAKDNGGLDFVKHLRICFPYGITTPFLTGLL